MQKQQFQWPGMFWVWGHDDSMQWFWWGWGNSGHADVAQGVWRSICAWLVHQGALCYICLDLWPYLGLVNSLYWWHILTGSNFCYAVRFIVYCLAHWSGALFKTWYVASSSHINMHGSRSRDEAGYWALHGVFPLLQLTLYLCPTLGGVSGAS
jgi:hypothetical protein